MKRYQREPERRVVGIPCPCEPRGGSVEGSAYRDTDAERSRYSRFLRNVEKNGTKVTSNTTVIWMRRKGKT
jgi:hypothetical protein